MQDLDNYRMDLKDGGHAFIRKAERQAYNYSLHKRMGRLFKALADTQSAADQIAQEIVAELLTEEYRRKANEK